MARRWSDIPWIVEAVDLDDHVRLIARTAYEDDATTLAHALTESCLHWDIVALTVRNAADHNEPDEGIILTLPAHQPPGKASA